MGSWLRGLKMKSGLVALTAILIVTVCGGTLCGEPASAEAPHKKPYTVTDRQNELRKKVAVAAKQNELTQKEASKLNQMLDDVDADIQKMKSKNAGKLSYKDEGKVEKRLNKVSLDLQKYQLAKRVTAH
jgi:hypothetical protein